MLKLRGVRKKTKSLVEIKNWRTGECFYFWRTKHGSISKEWLKKHGIIDVDKDGSITRVVEYGKNYFEKLWSKKER